MCALAITLVTTVNTQVQQVREEIVFHVYWSPSTAMNVVQQQWRTLNALPHFLRKETFTPQEAYASLAKDIIPPTIIPKAQQSTLLPPTASVYFSPKNIADIPAWIAQMQKTLTQFSGVEKVIHSPFKDTFLQTWSYIHQYVIIPVTVLLFFSLALIIGNTVALSLQFRATEVELLHLVGAPPWYILAPLSTSAIILGISSAVSALLLLFGVVRYFADILAKPPLLVQLQFPSTAYIILLLLVPPTIGFIGTWLTVRIKTS